MQFNDTVNKNGFIQRCEQECGLGDGAISGNTILLAQFTDLINNWVNAVNGWIHQVDKEHPYDDFNHGDFPIEEVDLTDDGEGGDYDGQQDFGLSDNGEKDNLVIKKVEVQDASTLKWSTLEFLLTKDIPNDEFGATKGKPSKYRLSGGNLVFDIPVDITMVSKYRLTYDRGAHLFVVGDTTAQPGFVIDFYPILYFGPSMDWCFGKKGKEHIVKKCEYKIFGNSQGNYEDPKSLYGMLRSYYLLRAQESKPFLNRKVKKWG